jgi:hypothetical protein
MLSRSDNNDSNSHNLNDSPSNSAEKRDRSEHRANLEKRFLVLKDTLLYARE